METSNNQPPPGVATGPHLPPHLYKVYLNIKTNTNDLLDWIRSNATSRQGISPFTHEPTVRQILDASRIVSRRHVDIPVRIKQALGRALRLRLSLTSWFRKVETATTGQESHTTKQHDYFNNALTEIQETWFPESETVLLLEKLSINSPSGTDSAHDAGAETNPDDQDAGGEMRADDHDKSEAELPSAESTNYHVQDDNLTRTVDTWAYVNKLDKASTMVHKWWKEARDGAIPVCLAAWLTEALRVFICDGDFTARASSNIGTASEVRELMLLMKLPTLIKPDKPEPGNGPSTRSGDSDWADVLQHNKFRTARAILAMEWATCKLVTSKLKLEKPGHSEAVPKRHLSSYFVPPRRLAEESERARILMNNHWAGVGSSNSESQEDQGLIAKFWSVDREPTLSILTTLWQKQVTSDLCCKKKDCHCLETQRDCLLSLPFIEHYLKTGQSCGLTCGEVWYIQSILESCSAFSWEVDGTTPSRINCRIQALQFAMEFQKSVEAVQFHEGSYHEPRLAYASKVCKSFLSQMHFDLAWQAPAVAGRQLDRIAWDAMNVGMELLNYAEFFGTVLHLYKSAQLATGGLNPIPILDQLCDFFKHPVFLGDFPSRRMAETWLRYTHTPIERQHKDAKTHSRSAWKPSRKNEEERLRINPEKLSPWFNITLSGFKLYGENFVSYLDPDTKKTTSKGHMRRVEREFAKKSMEAQFEDLKAIGLRNFQGAFPVARINYFEVQRLAVETILELGKQGLSDPGLHSNRCVLDSHDRDVQLYVGRVDLPWRVLSRVDELNQNGRALGSKSLLTHPWIKMVQETIAGIWQGKTVEDLCWKSL